MTSLNLTRIHTNNLIPLTCLVRKKTNFVCFHLIINLKNSGQNKFVICLTLITWVKWVAWVAELWMDQVIVGWTLINRINHWPLKIKPFKSCPRLQVLLPWNHASCRAGDELCIPPQTKNLDVAFPWKWKTIYRRFLCHKMIHLSPLKSPTKTILCPRNVRHFLAQTSLSYKSSFSSMQIISSLK